MRYNIMENEEIETNAGLTECNCWLERLDGAEPKMFLSFRFHEMDIESFQFSISLTGFFDTINDVVLVGGGYGLSIMACVVSALKKNCKDKFESCKDKDGEEFWECLKSKKPEISKDIRNAMITCAVFKK